ncbi:hypothetical protein HYS48_05175 [Candidatus Woesearchaeota archaeon]|nr:hypothetical protein [Candidatus Woesearchaeota archaeon]
MEIAEDILKKYMLRCIELAKQAPDSVGKPYVGALVLSRDGATIVGEGYRTLVEHTNYLLHAERMALEQAGQAAKGGALITTLEPCVRIKPTQIFACCAELIVERGIETVIIGMLGGSPSMSMGSGIAYLKAHGIVVRRYRALNSNIQAELMPRKPLDSLLSMRQ